MSMRQTELVRYVAHGRNGYTAIDEYRGDSCQRNIDAFGTRKQGNLTAQHLNGAYMRGWADATAVWPSAERTNPPDLPAYGLSCPIHSHDVGQDTPDEAHASHVAHHCEPCRLVAEFIRTRDTLRRLTVALHKAEQDHEDEKHGTGPSYKSGATRPKRV